MRLGRSLPPRDARGQVLIVVALLFVILMIFSAFVIDVGRAYLERRQDVTAADGGVLGGASWLLQKTNPRNPTLPFNKDVIGREAIEVARLSMRPVPSPAAWDNLFAACSDADRPDKAEFPDGNSYRPLLTDNVRYTDCVRFNRSFTKMRVRLPNQTVETTFARVIGINQLYTHAVAEAGISWTSSGAVMPFAVQPGSGNPEDLMCFRLDSCDEVPTWQPAKVLDAPLLDRSVPVCGWMPESQGNPVSNPGTNVTDVAYRAAQNAAVGLDHVVVVKVAADPNRHDDCGPRNLNPRQVTPLPNRLYAMEFDGLNNNIPAAALALLDGLSDGLLFACVDPCDPSIFSDGGPPRLQRVPAGWPTRTLERNGVQYVVEDRPLWDFIRPAAPGYAPDLPATCDRDSFDAPTTGDDLFGPTIGHMTKCLGDWLNPLEPGYPFQPLFDYDSGPPDDKLFDIELSARAGLVPTVGNPAQNPNWTSSPVTGFRGAFIQTFYLHNTNNCPPAGCAVEYNPGVATTGPDDPIDDPINVTGLRVIGMGFYQILPEMLPEDARPTQLDSLGGEVELLR